MSGQYGPPPGLDVNQSQQNMLWAALIVPYGLAFITVQLRLLSRKMSRSGSWFDDWLIVAAMAIDTGILAGTIISINQGLGKHIWTFPISDIESHSESILLGLFELDNMYYACSGTIKLAILAFYFRTFKRPFIKRLVFILNMATVLWAGVSITMTVLECEPISGFWIDPLEANCPIPRIPVHVALSIVNAAINFAIVLLPLPFFIFPHHNHLQSLVLVILFGFGLFVSGISIVRTLAVANTDITDIDLSYNLSNAWAWTAVEVQVAIMAVNLPTLGPVIARIIPKLKEESFTPSPSTSSESLDSPETHNPFKRSKKSRNQASPRTELNGVRSPGPAHIPRRRNSVDLGYYEADEKTRSMHVSAGSWYEGDSARVRSLQDAIVEWERTQGLPTDTVYSDWQPPKEWDHTTPSDWEKGLMRPQSREVRVQPLDPEKRRNTSSPQEGSSTLVTSPTAMKFEGGSRPEWMRAYNFSPINRSRNDQDETNPRSVISGIAPSDQSPAHPLRSNAITPFTYERAHRSMASEYNAPSEWTDHSDASSHAAWSSEKRDSRDTFSSYDYPPPPPPPRRNRTRALSNPESNARDSSVMGANIIDAYASSDYGRESRQDERPSRAQNMRPPKAHNSWAPSQTTQNSGVPHNVRLSYSTRNNTRSPEPAVASQMTVTKVRPPPPQHQNSSPQIPQGLQVPQAPQIPQIASVPQMAQGPHVPQTTQLPTMAQLQQSHQNSPVAQLPQIPPRQDQWPGSKAYLPNQRQQQHQQQQPPPLQKFAQLERQDPQDPPHIPQISPRRRYPPPADAIHVQTEVNVDYERWSQICG